MTREEFLQTGWTCSYEEYLAFDCSSCERKKDCIHHDAYRRVPESQGGLGLCYRLKEVIIKE